MNLRNLARVVGALIFVIVNVALLATPAKAKWKDGLCEDAEGRRVPCCKFCVFCFDTCDPSEPQNEVEEPVTVTFAAPGDVAFATEVLV